MVKTTTSICWRHQICWHWSKNHTKRPNGHRMIFSRTCHLPFKHLIGIERTRIWLETTSEHRQLISIKDYFKSAHSLTIFPQWHPIIPYFSPYHESAMFLTTLFMPVLFVIFINSDKPIIMIINICWDLTVWQAEQSSFNACNSSVIRILLFYIY